VAQGQQAHHEYLVTQPGTQPHAVLVVVAALVLQTQQQQWDKEEIRVSSNTSQLNPASETRLVRLTLNPNPQDRATSDTSRSTLLPP
jgi:hypothetical protein